MGSTRFWSGCCGMGTSCSLTQNLALLYSLGTQLDNLLKFEGNGRIFGQGWSKTTFGVQRNDQLLYILHAHIPMQTMGIHRFKVVNTLSLWSQSPTTLGSPNSRQKTRRRRKVKGLSHRHSTNSAAINPFPASTTLYVPFASCWDNS